MKKRLLTIMLCFCMVMTLLPSNIFALDAYSVKSGEGIHNKMKYLYLQNPYITFAVYTGSDGTYNGDRDWNAKNLANGGFTTATAPTRVLDNIVDVFAKGGEIQSVSISNYEESNNTAFKTSVVQQITSMSSMLGSDKEGAFIKLNLSFKDPRLAAVITYRIVRLKSTSSNTTQNWGIAGDIEFSHTKAVAKNFIPYLTTYVNLGKMGRYGTVPNPSVKLGAYRYEAKIQTDTYNYSQQDISSGLGLTNTMQVWEKPGNVGYIRYPEVYTDNYPWANPFVALDGFYYNPDFIGHPNIKLLNEFVGDSAKLLDTMSVEGYDDLPIQKNKYAGVYLPNKISYGGTLLSVAGGNTKLYYNPQYDPLTTQHQHSSTKVGTLWGFRKLYKKDDVVPFTQPDLITIDEKNQMLAIFPSGNGFKAISVQDDKVLKDLVSQNNSEPVAVIRGDHTALPDGSFEFTGRAASLTPTVIATWTGGFFKVGRDGSIIQRGMQLSTPAFKFYQGKTADGLNLSWNKDKGLVMGIDPNNNSAMIYVDIPYAHATLSGGMAKANGNLIFTGSIGLDTVFEGASLGMEKLGFGLKNGQFKMSGVKANGNLNTADLFNMELADIKGEINTFPGEEKYDFEMKINAFDLFETEAELKLKRANNGVLMPNNLYLYLGSDQVGIPLVSPVVVAEINGGGAGFYGLADTVNGDFVAVPPIRLRGTVSGKFLKIVEGTHNIVIGPGVYEASGTDIKFIGTSDSSEILKYFGFKVGVGGQQRNYKGVSYNGLQMGSSVALEAVLPSGDLDIVKINGSIGASAFGGVDASKYNLYLMVSANGKIEGVIQIPSRVPVIGGRALLGSAIDAIVGGQTVIPIRGATVNEAAKEALKNMDLYLGVASTTHVLGSDFRIWVVLPHVAKDSAKGKHWDYDYAIFSKLQNWDWSTAGIPSGFRARAMQSLEELSMQTMETTTGSAIKLDLQSDITTEPALHFAPQRNGMISANITLANLEEGENSYLALAFDNNVTEEQIRNQLTIQENGNPTPMTLEWLRQDGSNHDDANISSDIVSKNDGSSHRLVIVHVGDYGASGKTYQVKTSDLPFTWEQTETQPMDSLVASFSGQTVTANIKYPISGKKYSLRTYLAEKQGGADYLIDEQEIENINDSVSVPVPSEGTIAPTGNYYVSTFLMEEKTGDFNGDGTDETLNIAIDSADFSDIVSYRNTMQPESPADVKLKANGNETMLGIWTKVDGANGYQVTIYKNDNGKWIDSGFGYQLTVDQSNLSEPKNLPKGLSYDSSQNRFTLDMAVTVGGKNEEGQDESLPADKNYKIGVKAYKMPILNVGDDIDKTKYYSAETTSDLMYLPAYNPLEITLKINDGDALSADKDTNIYTAYVKESNNVLHVSANGSPSFKVKRLDNNEEILDQNAEGYPIPDVVGSIMLEITGEVQQNDYTDITTQYLIINKDDIAPILTLDASSYFADPDSGRYKITGHTEPGAKINGRSSDEQGHFVQVFAGTDGSFSLEDNMRDDKESIFEPITAIDAAGNESNTAYASVGIKVGNAQMCNIQASASNSAYGSVIGGGSVMSGNTATVKAVANSGYHFVKWIENGTYISKDNPYTFTVNADRALIAVFEINSSSGSTSGGGSSSGRQTMDTPVVNENTKITNKSPDRILTAELTIQATLGQNGIANAEIPEKALAEAIQKAKEEAKKSGNKNGDISVKVNVNLPKNTKGFILELSENVLNTLISEGISGFDVQTSLLRIHFDKNALASIKANSKGSIKISAVPNTKLSENAKKMVGTRPVFDITLSYEGTKQITKFGNGIATVFIPYSLKKNETAGGLYAVYIDEKGSATRIDRSAYDINSESVIFSTNHFSLYAVGYTAPSEKFNDIKNHWAKDAIDYVVGRGLLTGTDDKFSPNAPMTRGMLVTALGRLSGVNVKDYAGNSFTDVGADSSYRPYIEWAYKKGIVSGIGDGKFAPDRAITREEIAVIFEGYAKVTGYTLPILRGASTYADNESIGEAYKTAVTAMQQAGIMMGGTGNKFNPKGNATRAEVSSILNRYIKLTIIPETAVGLIINDAGK